MNLRRVIRTIPLFKVGMSEKAPEAVAEVLKSGYIGQGPKVEEFEKKISEYIGKRILTISSCTHGLDLAYHLAGIKHGSTVISTPMTCTATHTPIVNRGANIIWADVTPQGLIDPLSVEKILKKNSDIQALIIVDWSGRDCDFKHLSQVIEPYALPVIEDAAHVHHPIVDRPANWYTCYSYQAIKHLTTGDGGGLVVPPEQYQRAKLLRWFGLDRESKECFRCSQDITEAGYKYHMNDICATIGLANMDFAKKSVKAARANAKYYEEELSADLTVVELPFPDDKASWWTYPIKTPRREEFMRFCADNGITATPAHRRNDRMTAFPKADGPLPQLDDYDSKQVAIPVGWWLDEDDKRMIVHTIKKWDYKVRADGI